MARTILAILIAVTLFAPTGAAFAPLYQISDDLLARPVDANPETATQVEVSELDAHVAPGQPQQILDVVADICRAALAVTIEVTGRNYDRQGPLQTPFEVLLETVTLDGKIKQNPASGTLYWYKWTPSEERFQYRFIVTPAAAATAPPEALVQPVQVCDDTQILPVLPPTPCPGYQECATLLPNPRDMVEPITTEIEPTEVGQEYDCPTRYSEDQDEETDNDSANDPWLRGTAQDVAMAGDKATALASPLAWESIGVAAFNAGLTTSPDATFAESDADPSAADQNPAEIGRPDALTGSSIIVPIIGMVAVVSLLGAIIAANRRR